ncbi:hypothetical protein OUZ56_032754 [Daphnia magna]|uniref:Uncharacterized protein n=1 Tax=Daphnia magna TaxID=35525 RepID=A0ABQ9ZX08_9CRUS|nr:hypothetical protein OUZ56_032754 [Daphnia magna]
MTNRDSKQSDGSPAEFVHRNVTSKVCNEWDSQQSGTSVMDVETEEDKTVNAQEYPEDSEELVLPNDPLVDLDPKAQKFS